MVNPVLIVQVFFGLAWVWFGVIAAWLGRRMPWRKTDISTLFISLVLFIFFGMVALTGAVVAWADSPPALKVVGVLGGLMGLGGVVSYFLARPRFTPWLFLGQVLAGVASLILVSTG